MAQSRRYKLPDEKKKKRRYDLPEKREPFKKHPVAPIGEPYKIAGEYEVDPMSPMFAASADPLLGVKLQAAQRFIGGPAARFMQIPQQLTMAYEAAALGRPVEGWKWYLPHAAVIFPGKYGRLTEEYVTNSDNALLNFSHAMLVDPINFFPANAVTKIGKAKNLIKSISFIDDVKAVKLATRASKGVKNTKAMQKLYEGLHVESLIEPTMRQEAITNWLRKSDSAEMVTKKLRSLGATSKDIKAIDPLYKMMDGSPEGISGALKSSWWNSEKLMNHERTLIGFDPLMGGWTGNARWAMPRAIDTEAGKLVGKMENWWTKINKNAGIRQITKEATMWERTTRSIPEKEAQALQNKVNKASKNLYDNYKQVDEAEVKLNFWKSKRNRNQALKHADDLAYKKVEELKVAKNDELGKINSELQTLKKAESAGVLRSDKKLRSLHGRMQATKDKMGEWANQYKLTRYLSKNQINKMVRTINKSTEENIKLLENSNEVEREFLFKLRKMFSDRVKPIEYAKEIKVADEIIDNIDIGRGKKFVLKNLLKDERAVKGYAKGEKLSMDDFELANEIVKQSEHTDIEKIIGNMPLSRELKSEMGAKYQHAKAISKQTKMVFDNDAKINGMWKNLKDTKNKDSAYYKDLVRDVPRLLNKANDSMLDMDSNFNRLWKLHQETRGAGVSTKVDYHRAVTASNTRKNKAAVNWSRNISNARKDNAANIKDIKEMTSPNTLAKKVGGLKKAGKQLTDDLAGMQNELVHQNIQPELVHRTDPLFMMERFKKMATATKFKELADRADDLNVLYEKVLEIEPDNPGIWRTITRGIEDGRPDAENFYLPEQWDIVQGFRKVNANYYLKENLYRSYSGLGDNYLMRTLTKNDKGSLLLRDFLTMHVEPLRKTLKGWGKDVGFLDKMGGMGNPLLKASNESQFTRVVGESKKVTEYVDNLTKLKAEFVATGKLDKAQELIPAIDFLKKYNKVLRLDKKWGPIRSNDEFAKIFKSDIKDFYRTKTGKKWGFKPDDPEMLFKMYNDDVREIMSGRTIRYAEQVASGKTFKLFGDSFFYDTVTEPKLIQAIKDSGLTNLIDVKKGLAERLAGTSYGRLSSKSMEELLGLTADNKVASEQAVDSLADMLIGWTRVIKGPINKNHWYAQFNRFWSNSALYGGRTVNVQQDFIGDRWQMFLEHVAVNNMLPTPKIINAYLPQGHKAFGYKGKPDADILINTGRRMLSYGDVRNKFNQLEVQKGFHQSDVVGMAEMLGGSPNAELKGLSNIMNWTDMKKGRMVTGIYQVRAWNEQTGRFGTFVDSLEKGQSYIEAYERVQVVHFDYSKMNDVARNISPFYYWQFRNIPRQFKKMFEVPAKQTLPTKLISASRGLHEDERGEEPLMSAEVPEYLLSKGVHLPQKPKGYEVGSDYSGKDMWFDPSQLPPFAALEMTGLLNNPEGLDDVMIAAGRNLASGAGPVIQLPIELIINKDIWTDRAIYTTGVTGKESGIKDFFGLNIEGQRGKQMFAHGVRSLFPPAAVVEQHINAFKNYPQGLATAKTIGGLPIRLSDRDVAVFVKFGKEMSLLKGNRDRLVRNRDIREAKGLSTQKLDDQIDTMEERIKDLNKEYSKRAADMGKRKEDEYDDKLDDITRRRK